MIGQAEAGGDSCRNLAGKQQNFLRAALIEQAEGLSKVLEREGFAKQRIEVKAAALEQRSHLHPGLVHAAAEDALQGDAARDEQAIEIECNGLAGDAE